MATDDADLLANDPRTLFGNAAQMFAVPYEEIRDLQLDAVRERFRTLRPKVRLLDRLAARNGVDDIDDLGVVGRLLYPSNVYKSYPLSWLVDGEYDRLTRWVQQLTAHDLSSVDVAGIESIDEWFRRIDTATDLRLCHSSSTSGKLSFVPRGEDEWVRRAATLPFASEAAGTDPGPHEVSFEGLPLILPFYRHGRSAAVMHYDWFVKVLTDPDGTHPDRVLALHSGALSSELLVLAGRLRSGQLSGDAHTARLPERLLDRRDELAALMSGTASDQMDAFVAEASERFGGERCVVSGVWPSVVDAAEAASRLGLRHVFDPSSFLLSGGGGKGRTVSADGPSLVRSWTGIERIEESYGMSELMGMNAKCSVGRFHLNPWLIPFVLDVDTLEPISGASRATGRLGAVDLLAGSYWSGYVSTDVVTLNWEPACACGRNGPYLDPDVGRAQNVENDKISCSATPEAHDETIEFLRAQGV